MYTTVCEPIGFNYLKYVGYPSENLEGQNNNSAMIVFQ